MISVGKVIGSKSPVTAKALEVMPSLGIYLKWKSFLNESQWWSTAEIEDYQFRAMKRLLNHCHKNVPYYQNLFREMALTPDDFQRIKDLEKLPVLTKGTIRRNLDKLVARNVPREKLEYVTTAGSSGIPLGFYYQKGATRAVEWAFIKTLWERVGYSFADRCAVFKGFTWISKDENSYWTNSLLGRWKLFSSFQISGHTFKEYSEELRRFKPKYIQAHPSIASVLAHRWRNQEVGGIDGLKAFLCGSEMLLPNQRELLEEVFKARVYSWYGQSERVVLAGECETSNDYHVLPEYGILEVANPSDVSKKAQDGRGVIIGTSLTSLAMPLIRYLTDDICTLSQRRCECGRNHQIIASIDGRLQEMLVGKNGERIPTAALNMHSDVFDNVEQFQYFQNEPGRITLNVVKGELYSERDTNKIMRAFKEKLGDAANLELSFVDQITRIDSGKHRLVIQHLDTKGGNGVNNPWS